MVKAHHTAQPDAAAFHFQTGISKHDSLDCRCVVHVAGWYRALWEAELSRGYALHTMILQLVTCRDHKKGSPAPDTANNDVLCLVHIISTHDNTSTSLKFPVRRHAADWCSC